MNDETKVIIRLSFFPLIFLLVLIIVPLPFYFKGVFNYIVVMPLIIFLSGIIVIAIGAFWDFGAKIYLKEVMDSKIKITDDDIVFIHKKQLKMTLIYIIIGLIYFGIAFIIYYI